MDRVATFGAPRDSTSIRAVSPSTRSISPTPTLTDATPLPATSSYIHRSNSTTTSSSSIDSIWNQDYAAGAEERRREDDAVLAEILDSRPGLTIGFAVSSGQDLSRRPSKQPSGGGKRSVYSSRANSRAVSRVDLTTEEMEHQAQLEFPKPKPSRGVWGAMERNRRKMRSIMRLKKFHLIMIGLVAFDLGELTFLKVVVRS